MIEIKAGEFKAKCLQLMNLAQSKHETIVITKRGIPIAKLIAYEETPNTLFGFMKNSIRTQENIVESLNERWDAETFEC